MSTYPFEKMEGGPNTRRLQKPRRVHVCFIYLSYQQGDKGEYRYIINATTRVDFLG
jgi:hypothetical protein